jgi:peptide/nickel transport system permease protein
MTAATKVAEILPAEAMPEEESQFSIVLRRFRRHKLAVVSFFFVIVAFLVAVFAKQIAPVNYDTIEVGNPFAAPFSTGVNGVIHYLGTDHLGRDFFSRIIYAARISLSVALISTISSTLVGVVVGAVSGYYGGWVDAILSRFLEFLITIPQLPLLLIISSLLLQNPDLLPIPPVVVQFISRLLIISELQALQVVLLIVVLVAFGWTGVAQLMRGMVLALREQQFVEAARAMGANDAYIIFRHMVPNSLAPIIVAASLAMAGFVVTEAALSFLGLGIQDPTPTWGNMLASTESYMFQHPYLPLIPGLPIFMCSLAFNYVGDGLRDALDPRLKL